MGNTWMASNGLDIDFDETTEEIVKVTYGELEGTFVSYETDGQKLKFQTSDTGKVFDYLDQSLGRATISYNDFSHTIKWDQYNYKIAKGSNYTMVVTIESIQHEQ